MVYPETVGVVYPEAMDMVRLLISPATIGAVVMRPSDFFNRETFLGYTSEAGSFGG
jgi:hypothetical protein